jgi:hypothetical protein
MFLLMWIWQEVINVISPAETAALFVAGLVAPFVVSALKKFAIDVKGKAAYTLTLAVSFVIAIAVMLWTHDIQGSTFSDFLSSLFKSLASVALVATSVYKFFEGQFKSIEQTSDSTSGNDGTGQSSMFPL